MVETFVFSDEVFSVWYHLTEAVLKLRKILGGYVFLQKLWLSKISNFSIFYYR